MVLMGAIIGAHGIKGEVKVKSFAGAPKAIASYGPLSDAKGRAFTFPIPTYNITPDFDWHSPNAERLFEMTAKYGLPYAEPLSFLFVRYLAVIALMPAGLHPAGVILCAGGTSVGAFDRIGDTIAVARAHGLYTHVDAAWAGSAMIWLWMLNGEYGLIETGANGTA